MAEQDTRVRGIVSVASDSKEKVALDLLEKIKAYEEMDRERPRRYFLELYAQCWQAVHGNEPDSNIQERPRRG